MKLFVSIWGTGANHFEDTLRRLIREEVKPAS
jgi:hypothetical protein